MDKLSTINSLVISQVKAWSEIFTGLETGNDPTSPAAPGTGCIWRPHI
jgi:hypothetical protein